MLINLHIVNLALIDELDIDFRPGLNILTGETGAGKSIIIGSIGIGLGGRYDTGLLRDPEKDGLVELLFSVDDSVAALLREEEIDVEDGEVLVSRRLTGGRSVNRINDKTVTIAKLRKVSECLISLHAQHEQRTLLKASKHLELVDKYSDKIPALKEKVSGIYKEFKSVSDKLETMSLDETERAKKLDYIRYEINDIESARLTPGEDTELEDIYKKASNAQEIAEITGETMELVGYDSDRSAGSQLSRAVRTLNGLTKLDPAAEELVKTLTDIDTLMSDFAGQLSDYASNMEYDEDTLRSTEERLNLINTLKARYGSSIEDINSTLDKLKCEEEELASYEDTIASLENEKIKLRAELEKECDKLTAERKKSAKALCKTIADSMKELNFERVSFDMEFERLSDYTSNGIDSAQFIISTNVGEDMKPLVDTASGGELSRVMLAIKSVLSESDDTPTLIFDEIDVGISGITAEKVGNMMHKLSESRQIISITHLPQIAAAADSAYVIEKKIVGEKTNTSIRSLDMDGRIKELARLLGGAKVTDSVIATAKEMIAHN